MIEFLPSGSSWIWGEIPKTHLHYLIFLPPLLFGQMPLHKKRMIVEGLEYNPVCKGFIFTFKPALDFQEPKVQIAAGLIQPFHKQFSTMQFV